VSFFGHLSEHSFSLIINFLGGFLEEEEKGQLSIHSFVTESKYFGQLDKQILSETL